MDALFDLVLTLAPISLFIALRIYMSQKKRSEEDERARLAQILAKAAKEEESPRPTFAELSALVEEAENESAEVVAAPISMPKPIPRLAAAGPGPAPRIEAMESVSLSQVAPPSARPTARNAAATAAAADARLFARLERMSPLRRAVVMAEILGRPKGM